LLLPIHVDFYFFNIFYCFLFARLEILRADFLLRFR
jgi:hypothetical protein